MIEPNEKLGREVFNEKTARRVARGTCPVSLFMYKRSPQAISVNRLSIAWWDKLIAIGEEHAVNTHSGCFYGWATIRAEDAASDGRSVVSTPTCENRYHADICLPSSVLNNRDELREQAVKLAAMTMWCSA